MGTDRDWETWGKDDPYFGVLSTERYRRHTVDDEALNDFFESGHNHVRRLLATIRTNFDPRFTPETVLDFGCGVGRLLIPFSRSSAFATGVDVSPSMLKEAEANCRKFGADNVKLILADDNLESVPDSYDLVHSVLVLQHISEKRSLRIVGAMAQKAKTGGYVAIQFYSACHAPRLVRMLVKLRYLFPPANYLRNLLRRRPLFEPAMQIHTCDYKRVLDILGRNGFGTPWLAQERVSGGDFDSVFLVARKNTD